MNHKQAKANAQTFYNSWMDRLNIAACYLDLLEAVRELMSKSEIDHVYDCKSWESHKNECSCGRTLAKSRVEKILGETK